MEKNLRTGDFIVSEDKNKPIILMIFNQLESNVENVNFNIKDNYLLLKYKSGNILKTNLKEKSLQNKINERQKILIIEIDEDEGDIQKIYFAIKKPA